ncbi:MAG: hypothetical protein KAJ31_08875 [Deltaproteobacteria bacterium]|nr:hypothetical protein [Deltaproteobacteria bacterium]
MNSYRIIPLIALLICFFITSYSFAQDSEEAIFELDCAIPLEAQHIRPGTEGTEIPVKIGFFVIDIKEIDDLEQTYTADFWFNTTWNDPRLSEKVLGKSLENCIYKINEIWAPQVIVINRNGGEELLDIIARVDSDGNVNFKQRYVGELTSDLDFADFPFDNQVLHFIMAAVGVDGRDIAFEVDNTTTGQRSSFSAEGWTIKLADAKNTNELLKTWGDEPILNLKRIDFTLVAERAKLYYLWKVIAPLCLIVLMAWAVFWIDPKHLGPQVGLSTATVFTLIAYRFSVGFSLPKVPYFTRLDAFVLFSTLLVFIALGTAIATSKISSDGKNRLAKKIEKYMRVIYLIVFVSIIVFTLLL